MEVDLPVSFLFLFCLQYFLEIIRMLSFIVMGDRAFEKIGLHRKIARSFTAQNTSKINKNDQHARLHQHKINTLFNNNHFQLRKHILYGIAQCDHWNCRGLSFWFMLINRLTPIFSSSIRRNIAWYCHYNLLLLSYKLHLLHQQSKNKYTIARIVILYLGLLSLGDETFLEFYFVIRTVNFI